MKDAIPVAPMMRFELNRVYERWPEINDLFGGSRQSGIAPSRRAPVIFLFTGDTGEKYGYQDHFDADGVFCYSGEGQVGDMKMTKGNLAVTRHAKEGRALHVFKSLGKSKGQEYMGEFVYANHNWLTGPDKKGNLRKVIVFHLVPVRTLEEIAESSADMSGEYVPASSLSEARKRALAALHPQEGGAGKQALRTVHERSKAVRDYVLLRAAGICECCDRPAPFSRRDGSPYLEPHHLTKLSDGGMDHPESVAALCPACHREVHYGKLGLVKNEVVRTRVKKLESMASKTQLKLALTR